MVRPTQTRNMPGMSDDPPLSGSLLLDLLDAHPAGLSEHALLGLLDERGVWGGEAFDYHDAPALFQRHFLLFHALYRLRDQLRVRALGDLAISALRIVKLDYSPGATALAEPDPLREYYLDLGNLENTSPRELDEMLGRFWSVLHARDDKRGALQVLQLTEPLDRATIKHQYRKLVMLHHPDRGGNTARLQELNAAAEILLTIYRD